MPNWVVELMGGPTNAYALASGGGGGDQPIWAMLFPFAVVFAIIYFLMIRPQQKKQQEHQSMLNQLKAGDNVLASGIFGEVTKIKDDTVHLKIADNVRIRVHRSAISAVLSGSGGADESKDQPSEKPEKSGKK
jgi:preprotein translocase subunit YajC